jgi:hypothetical protein
VKALVRLMTVPAGKRDMPWVREGLHAAIQLELSTIPPYLYAAWSIDQNADPSGCRQVITEIAKEEMLHMGIACNVLTAVGGRPDIVGAASVYPTQLPTHIHKGLVVGLAPLSPAVLLDTFMAIEEPSAHLVDDPDFTPSGATLIGQFYDELYAALAAAAPTFTTAGQVDLTPHFPTAPPLIAKLQDASDAIDLIKRQGEGTAAMPFEDSLHSGELAHFYQFGEIFHGHRLTRTSPFTYSGNAVTIPAVHAVEPAPPTAPGAAVFDQAYSNLLRSLQRVWDGDGTKLGDSISAMFELDTLADNLVAAGFGPAFRVVDAPQTLPPPPPGNRFGQVTGILDAAVGPGAFGAHGPFWRGQSRDHFVTHVVFGKQLLVIGNGSDSNLVKALRGQSPFGSDTGTTGALFERMPARRAPVAPADIDTIERWIDDGCPDTAPVVTAPQVSLTTGAFRPDPSVHVAYFRDLDNWSMFHATPDVQAAIGTVFDTVPAWMAFARDPANEQAWLDTIADDSTVQALTMLAARQKQTLEAHYGVPVPLLTVLDGFERFGNDGLPDDPLRPEDPRHNMNGAIMWFVLGAFADACVRRGISTEFWTFLMRAILCGLLNDGLFRGRFTVVGFTATDEGRQAVFEHAQNVTDADLPAEIRRRYIDSEL